ncbi:MAG: penicillin-binding transpeptidase domain-containing protein [bacterium]|nr:penicillin-binding transpeptidase domain-containing protein [bacterium]
MKNDDLHFEEAMFDGLGRSPASLELPLHRSVFVGAVAVAFFAVTAMFIRVGYLNITRGDFYVARAAGNASKETVLPAQRGVIVDRTGLPLVSNEPIFSVFLNVPEFLKKDPEARLTFIERLRGILSADELRGDIGDIVRLADLERSAQLLLEQGVSVETAIALKGLNEPAVGIANDYRRNYLYGPAFAHLLGYTGIGDIGRTIQGKDGLEAFYDTLLRGEDGYERIMRDVRGNVLEKRVSMEPTPGNTLETTIDGELQQYFYGRMRDGLRLLGRTAGVGIILNPKTGEILSLVNLPSYDDNLFTLSGKNDARGRLLRDAAHPLFNRAVSGVYSPGSTIKPMMALAGLHEGVIDPTTSVFSSGVLELANPYDPAHPSKFLDWKAHGWVNLYSALARSSNIYFYVLGGGFGDKKGLGVARIESYWRDFGFADRTGVDLPGEASGIFYGPEEHERRTGRPWRVGDTYNVSIGQGDMMVTPLRLLSFIGAIGAGGHEKQPYLMQTVRDAKGEIVESAHPRDILDFSEYVSEIHEVQQGMNAAVQKDYGTAHKLADLPLTVAGKTGSAQIQNNTKTNAFFVGYAPAENPELAILVLIEDAKEGSLNTIPIVKDVLQWYYEHRMAPGS